MHASGINFHKDYGDKREYSAWASLYAHPGHAPGTGSIDIGTDQFGAVCFHEITPDELIRLGELIADIGRELAQQLAPVCADGSAPAF